MRNRSGGSAVQSLTVGASAQVLPLIAGYGLNLVATPYVVSQLGLHDFGVWAMTGAIAQYAALLDLGVSRAVNRYVALFHARGDADSDRAVVGICVSVILGLGAVFGTFAMLWPAVPETVLRTGDPAFTRYLLLCSVVILTSGLSARVLAGASFGRGRQVPANIGLAVLGISQVSGGVLALTLAPNLHSFALGTTIGAVIGLCAVLGAIVIDEGRLTIGRATCGQVREISAFGMKTKALGAADRALPSGELVAGIVIGPAAAGAYELGIRLVQGVQAFGSAASVAITTHLTRAYATGGLAAIRSRVFTAHSSQRRSCDTPAISARSHRILSGAVVARRTARRCGGRGNRLGVRHRGQRLDRSVLGHHVCDWTDPGRSARRLSRRPPSRSAWRSLPHWDSGSTVSWQRLQSGSWSAMCSGCGSCNHGSAFR